MSNGNQQLTSNQKYQVWVTSWAEDGSKDAMDAEAACTRYHAVNRLVGQCNDIAEAVRIYEAHKNYDPYITKLVTWKTAVQDITDVFEATS